MPIMRSFSSFAPTPNLGANFTSGYNAGTQATAEEDQTAVAREKIFAEMVQHNNQMQMANAKLQQDAVMSKMELQAKQQAMEQQNMRQQQELQMEQAYKEQMIGLKNRELQQADAVFNFKVKEAATALDATQSYQTEAAKLMEGGMDENEAYMKSALKYGPQMHLPGTVYNQAFKQNQYGGEGIGTASDIEGLPNDQFKKVRTGPESIQVVRLPPNMSDDTNAPEGYTTFGNRVLRKVDPPEVADMKKQRDRLQKLHDEDGFGRTQVDKEAAGEKPPKSAKPVIERYKRRESEIRALDEKIKQGRSSKTSFAKAPEGAKEGKKFRLKSDPTKFGTVKNGYIVPDEEPTEKQ